LTKPYLGKYEDAISVYDTILTLNPHSSNAIGRKGLNLYDLGRLEEAISYFDKILDINSSDGGLLVEASKNKQLALDALKNAVK
jgi:tetratricopeptide (TPR) repeat protein